MIKMLMPRALRLGVKPLFNSPLPIKLKRIGLDLAALSVLKKRGTVTEKRVVMGVPILVTKPASDAPLANILYFHGGAYVMGGFNTHGRFCGHLAVAAQARVWLPDYRLAPEHTFPAALDDALAAYQSMLDEGLNPHQITLAGDSAGGGLALATAIAIRDQGLPLPAAIVLLSPWVDLTLGGASHQVCGDKDPMLSTAGLRRSAAAYRHGLPAGDPGCSPVYGDLSGLPPVQIQVGSEEILLSDAQLLAERLQAAGVGNDLQIYPKLWHVFQLHAGLLRESDAALAKIAQFIQRFTTSK